MKFTEWQLYCLESLLSHNYHHWTEKINGIRDYIMYNLIDVNNHEHIEV